MCVHRESQAQRAVKVLRKSHMDEEEKRMLFNEINILKEIVSLFSALRGLLRHYKSQIIRGHATDLTKKLFVPWI